MENFNKRVKALRWAFSKLGKYFKYILKLLFRSNEAVREVYSVQEYSEHRKGMIDRTRALIDSLADDEGISEELLTRIHSIIHIKYEDEDYIDFPKTILLIRELIEENKQTQLDSH